jgi:hypothetical protein
MIWRRVLVPAAYTLEELHGVIQLAMGWESLHLYQFRIRAVHYGSFELCVSSPAVTLACFQFRRGAKFFYEYDMVDFWRHEVRVEDAIAAAPDRVYPCCTAGAHACPPEECGGPAGYAERRWAAVGLEAIEDLEAIAEFVQDVVLDGNEARLQDAEARWQLAQTLERAEARQALLANAFSRRAVNARFRQDEHHVLMHQQLW